MFTNLYTTDKSVYMASQLGKALTGRRWFQVGSRGSQRRFRRAHRRLMSVSGDPKWYLEVLEARSNYNAFGLSGGSQGNFQRVSRDVQEVSGAFSEELQGVSVGSLFKTPETS